MVPCVTATGPRPNAWSEGEHLYTHSKDKKERERERELVAEERDRIRNFLHAVLFI